MGDYLGASMQSRFAIRTQLWIRNHVKDMLMDRIGKKDINQLLIYLYIYLSIYQILAREYTEISHHGKWGKQSMYTRPYKCERSIAQV